MCCWFAMQQSKPGSQVFAVDCESTGDFCSNECVADVTSKNPAQNMYLSWQTGLAPSCDSGCCLVAGDRGAREFLQKHGVSGAMAQKLVLKYSSTTEEAVRQDPYTCLTHASTSSTFR